jgi:hypothetical protein
VAAVWLFTDGVATEGICETAELVEATRMKLQDLTTPCSLFCFGLGTGVDARTLRELAGVGNGMYYHIKSSQEIAPAFADCLGGLLSVVAQDVRLTLEVRKGCALRKLWTPYANHLTTSSAWVQIPDLYSEEERDILVEIAVAALEPGVVVPEAKPIVEWSVQYVNAVTGQTDAVQAPALLSRPVVARVQPRPVELDEQRNRVLCAGHLESARSLADSGKLDEARAVLEAAAAAIESSPSASEAYCVGLRDDLKECISQMSDNVTYTTTGTHTMSNLDSCHSYQRSCGVGDRYVTRTKSSMILESAEACAPQGLDPTRLPPPRRPSVVMKCVQMCRHMMQSKAEGTLHRGTTSAYIVQSQPR